MKREVARGYCTASVHLLTSIRLFAFSEHHQLAVNYWQLMYSDEIIILYFFSAVRLQSDLMLWWSRKVAMTRCLVSTALTVPREITPEC